MRNLISRMTSSGLVWIWFAVLTIVVDRFSKIWMLAHLQLGESLELLPVLNFTLAYNTGAAFSFLHSASGWQHYLLGGLALIVSFYILICLARLPRNDWWQNLSLNLILAGALGNAWDRVAYGHVIDFVDCHIGEWHFAIFNIADSAICIGAFMLIILWLRQGQHASKQVS